MIRSIMSVLGCVSGHLSSHRFPFLQSVRLCGRIIGMKRSSYREQDYAFGQMMLTLRTRIGLTQEGLADFLGVSRRTVGAWEAGSKYPNNEHLKRFIVLAVNNRAFPSGHEAEEVRALWQAAHQKVLFNESWLAL